MANSDNNQRPKFYKLTRTGRKELILGAALGAPGRPAYEGPANELSGSNTMSRIKAILRFLHAWRHPDQIAHEVEAELCFHIEMRARANIEESRLLF
jgi:hypothetical protein